MQSSRLVSIKQRVSSEVQAFGPGVYLGTDGKVCLETGEVCLYLYFDLGQRLSNK